MSWLMWPSLAWVLSNTKWAWSPGRHSDVLAVSRGGKEQVNAFFKRIIPHNLLQSQHSQYVCPGSDEAWESHLCLWKILAENHIYDKRMKCCLQKGTTDTFHACVMLRTYQPCYQLSLNVSVLTWQEDQMKTPELNLVTSTGHTTQQNCTRPKPL